MSERGWTEVTIVAEFRKHVVYWQEKLRLRDIAFHVRVVDLISENDPNQWCNVRPYNCGANPYAVDLRIKRGAWDGETAFDVWATVAHECIHVMNWTMSLAFDPLEDHFAASQLNMAKVLMKRGNEKLAYKWEDILTGWFAADAPPKEMPLLEDSE